VTTPAPGDVARVAVEAALRQACCPLCRLVRLSEERRLWSYLYELTADIPVRKAFDRSLGWCPAHAWLAGEIAGQQDMVNGVRIARLYETVVMEYLDRTDGPTAPRNGPFRTRRTTVDVSPGSPCPVCEETRSRERADCKVLARLLAKPEGWEVYTQGDGLCNPHFWALQPLVTGELAAALTADHRARLRRLQDLLYGLQHKQNYDVTEPTTPGEDQSWSEAIWRFTGMRWERLILDRRRR
jgi:hypothetical protein